MTTYIYIPVCIYIYVLYFICPVSYFISKKDAI